MTATATTMPLPILVVNPNTTKSMTDGLEVALEPIIASGKLPRPTFFTAPSGIASINDAQDCHASAEAVFPSLVSPASRDSPSLYSRHSAILIACYSVHPLVRQLAAARIPVLGIFEASILASLALCLAPQDRFGIVTTGAVWDEILTRGVADFLGTGGGDSSTSGSRSTESLRSRKFSGVETTGLTAVELHSTPPEEVTRRLKEAVKRLIRRTQSSSSDGGGMVGFDEAIRAGCIEELGPEEGAKISIVDGVKAGYVMLEGMVRAG
ncbi:hypothetical protein C6P46_002570 [Rhodotorula mucilaginosa]|uniref:DCG1 protein n=1 Tax=Rhodotorula mucilaginosa TaxID=5537 RepID=A0A9P6W8Q6_RHOMI|nr:hypothetical protein C6P46_002570 [Rhodotorula mucilaginosa]